MKALAVVVILLASGANADEGVKLEARAHRGWLTGAGLGLGAVGAVALTFAAYQASMAEASAKGVAAYYSDGAAPTAREASLVGWMQERSARASEQAVALLIGGGLALAAGVTLVLVDGHLGRAELTLGVQPGGARVVLSGYF